MQHKKDYRQYKRLKARVIPTDNKEPIKNSQKNSGQTQYMHTPQAKEPLYNYRTLLLYSAFLGVFGVHRFYTKKNNSGLMMLILCIGSFGIISLLWNIIDLILITSGKFKGSDGQFIIPNSKKHSKLISGLAVGGNVVVLTLVIAGVFYFPQYMDKVTSETFDELQKPYENSQSISYSLNEPIEIVSANGEDIGTITIKSVRVLQGKKPFIEITSEMTKKTDAFLGDFTVIESNETVKKGLSGEGTSFLFEIKISEKTRTTLGLEPNHPVNWEDEPIGTTREVITYHPYNESKENIFIHITTFSDGIWTFVTVDLKPALENQE